MKRTWLTVTLVVGLCASPAIADDLAKFQDDSRMVVKDMVAKLGGALQKEMAANGPAATIKVCKELAPAITSELSRKTGQRVTRVSLKTRNPLLGSPDAWEQKVLADFAVRLEKKEDPATIEYAEIVTEPQGKFMRYMKAIPTPDVCLKCHGAPEMTAPQVREQLATEYPFDRATGYSSNQLRGAFSIKKAL
jgi:hypothetical protein